jgi:hypothetical protein
MMVRELILILEKYDPNIALVHLRPDYDSGVCTDVEVVIEQSGKRYPDSKRHWDLYCKDGDLDVVKVLLLD